MELQRNAGGLLFARDNVKTIAQSQLGRGSVHDPELSPTPCV